MTENMKQKLSRLEKKAKARNKNDAVEESNSPKKPLSAAPARGTGKSARSIRRDTKAELKRLADSSGIHQFDLFVGKEYPTLFTRLPLFPPMKRGRAREQQAENSKQTDFIRLKSRWDKGGVWRSGPALTVEDEDTLAGLIQLRNIGFSGNELLMPSKKLGADRNIAVSHGNQVKVHAVYCVVSELETLIKGREPPKKGWSGTVLSRRRQSIERLGATVLRFEQPQGLDNYRGKLIPLIELDWIGDLKNSCYYVQFHPAIVYWLEEYRTYINLDVRRQLTPFGRALYRFLASQVSNTNYKRDFEDILEAMGYEGKIGAARRSAEPQLKKLIELDVIVNYEFINKGPSKPIVLNVQFR